MRLLDRLRRILNPPRPEPFVKRTLESGTWKNVFDPPPQRDVVVSRYHSDGPCSGPCRTITGGISVGEIEMQEHLVEQRARTRAEINRRLYERREARIKAYKTRWIPIDGSYPPDPSEEDGEWA